MKLSGLIRRQESRNQSGLDASSAEAQLAQAAERQVAVRKLLEERQAAARIRADLLQRVAGDLLQISGYFQGSFQRTQLKEASRFGTSASEAQTQLLAIQDELWEHTQASRAHMEAHLPEYVALAADMANVDLAARGQAVNPASTIPQAGANLNEPATVSALPAIDSVI